MHTHTLTHAERKEKIPLAQSYEAHTDTQFNQMHNSVLRLYVRLIWCVCAVRMRSCVFVSTAHTYATHIHSYEMLWAENTTIFDISYFIRVDSATVWINLQ